MAPKAQSRAVSGVVSEIHVEIQRQRLTSYALAQKTGLRISTMQRLIAGEGSPTIATLDAVALALGLRIKVEVVHGSKS